MSVATSCSPGISHKTTAMSTCSVSYPNAFKQEDTNIYSPHVAGEKVKQLLAHLRITNYFLRESCWDVYVSDAGSVSSICRRYRNLCHVSIFLNNQLAKTCEFRYPVKGLFYVAFYTIVAISGQREARSRDYVLLLSNDFKGYL